MDLVLDTIKTGHQQGSKAQYGLAAGSGKRTSIRRAFGEEPPEYG